MRDHRAYLFFIMASVVVCLLLLHLIPSFSVGDYTVRQVNILSELGEMSASPDTAVTQPAPVATQQPSPVTHNPSNQDGLVRIAYYGDSFIEGDIMVEEVRRKLQQRFGGQGIGWVDVANSATNARGAISEQHSGFTEHLAMKHETYRADQAGVSERYYDAADGAHLSLHSKEFSKNTDTWDVARMFLRAKSPIRVTVTVEGGAKEEKNVPASPKVQMIETRGRMNNIDYVIHGSGAVVFGVALESDSGVIVDNFSMRGTSGVSIPYVPEATLSDFATLRPYDIILLQYGVNAVPARATQQQCEWYMKQMSKTIAHLRKTFPQAQIILASTPDRGTRSGGQVITAPGIPMLVDHQRKLAAKDSVAFFSLFDAMGGNGAMARLHEKGEAAADFIHITRTGGKELAGPVADYLSGWIDGGSGKKQADSGELAGGSEKVEDENVKVDIRLPFFNPSEPMLFTSGRFLIAMLLFALIYVILRSKHALRLAFVVLFSLYYYYACSGLCVLLLCLVTLADYLLARDGAGRKWALWTSVAMNMGLLVVFKYSTFFAGLLGFQSHILPLTSGLTTLTTLAGLSFFTFRSLSYAVDVYKGKCTPATSLLDYSFYLTFFPVLLAGPITRAKDFLPQVHRPLSVSSAMVSRGVFLIAVGLFKKAVISDYIGINFVDRVFDNATLFTGGEVLLAIYGYCFQIYCDFSGYSDIAIGIALLLGYHIPDNFRKPFLADSMSDFWRRWHISLSTWIRDYVYIPLGGNRHGRMRAWLNQMVAMTLCGLWHGASLTFVVWGAVHGLLVNLHKFFSQVVLRHDRHYHPTGWRRAVSVFVTFHVICATWVLFRAADMTVVGDIFTQLFTKFDVGVLSKVFVAYKEVFLLIALAVTCHFIPVRWQRRGVALLNKSGLIGCVLLLVVIIYLVIQVKASDIQPFIYFQF